MLVVLLLAAASAAAFDTSCDAKAVYEGGREEERGCQVFAPGAQVRVLMLRVYAAVRCSSTGGALRTDGSIHAPKPHRPFPHLRSPQVGSTRGRIESCSG